MEAAKDVVFPSRSLKRQLEDAQMKLKEMEEELRMIKGPLGEKRMRLEVTSLASYHNYMGNEFFGM